MDSDGVPSESDNCQNAFNVTQQNADGENAAANRAGMDALGDACDDDDDGDGYDDPREIALGRNAAEYCGVMRADVGLTLDPNVQGDGVINSLDLQRVAQFFGPLRGDVREGQNGDGNINSLDLQAVAQRFAKFVSSCS
jgi:hypothetical protein